MTVLFMGGEMGAFVPSGGLIVEENSSSGATAAQGYDSAFSRGAINVDGPSTGDPSVTYVETAKWTPETEGYLHFYLLGNLNSGSYEFISFWDNTDTEIFRILNEKISGGVSYTFTLQYRDAGAAWQTAGTFVSLAREHFDIYWNIDASGGMAMWSAGTKVIELTGTDLSHLSGVEYMRFHGWRGGGYYSQVIVTDAAEPTIGGRLLTIPLTGAGANSDFTGAYTSIDELAYDDADFIFSDTAGDVSLFSHSTTIPSGYALRAVAVTARAKRGASGPQNFQLAVRATGANAFSSTIALDVGYTANCAIWETNPTTAVAWVNGDLTGFQAGAKSIA